MPGEAVRKQPTVVQPCVDTPFNDFLHPSTAPPPLHSLHSARIVLILTISLLLGFFGRFLYLERCWEGFCCVGWKFNQVRFSFVSTLISLFVCRYRLSTRRRKDPLPYNTGRPHSALRDHPLAVSEDRPRSRSPILRSADDAASAPLALFLRRWAVNSQRIPPLFLSFPLPPFLFLLFLVLGRFFFAIYVFRSHPPSRKIVCKPSPRLSSWPNNSNGQWTVDGDPALTSFNVGPPRGPLYRRSSSEIP